MAARPLIALAAAALLVAPGCGGAEDVQAHRSVLLISVDTLRRDALGVHGRFPSPTPELDALAEQSVVFEDAYTVSPVTLPAHTSLLTGLYPSTHGVRDNGAMQVPSSARSLPELLEPAGYRSRAVVSAFVLNECFGLDQGFEQYQAPAREMQALELSVPQTRGDESVDRGLAAIDELSQDGSPFLLWLHLYDPHAPYDSPGVRLSDPLAKRYLGDVSYADAQLGRLFDGLRDRGLWGELVIVLTSDHGEGLEDGKEETHGFFLFDQTMRVPLFLHHPDLPPRHVQGPVSLVDVVPTLLELLRVPAIEDRFDGQSLLGAARSGRAAERTIGIESYLPLISHGWAPFQGGVRGTHKVIRSRELERYDRSSDPGEHENLHMPGDEVTAEMMRDVARIFDAGGRRLESETVDLDAADLAKLQALGYSGAISGLSDLEVNFSELPDAYERYPMFQRYFWDVGPMLGEGKTEEALAVLVDLLQQDPDNPLLLTRFAEIVTLDPETALQHVDEAEDALLKALALRPGDASIPWTLSRCAKLRADEHRAQMEAASRSGEQAAGRAATEAWRAQLERFHSYLLKVLELQPTDKKALGVLAAALAEESGMSASIGRADLAERQRRESLALIDRLLPLFAESEATDRTRYERLRDQLSP